MLPRGRSRRHRWWIIAGWFARTAYYVDIYATVVVVDAGEADVGVECIHDINADNREFEYMFTAATDGSGYLLAKMVPEGARVIGTVDGVEVIEATDGSFGSFDAAGLVFFSLRAGDSVQFDNVTASVPE